MGSSPSCASFEWLASRSEVRLLARRIWQAVEQNHLKPALVSGVYPLEISSSHFHLNQSVLAILFRFTTSSAPTNLASVLTQSLRSSPSSPTRSDHRDFRFLLLCLFNSWLWLCRSLLHLQTSAPVTHARLVSTGHRLAHAGKRKTEPGRVAGAIGSEAAALPGIQDRRLERSRRDEEGVGCSKEEKKGAKRGQQARGPSHF